MGRTRAGTVRLKPLDGCRPSRESLRQETLAAPMADRVSALLAGAWRTTPSSMLSLLAQALRVEGEFDTTGR